MGIDTLFILMMAVLFGCTAKPPAPAAKMPTPTEMRQSVVKLGSPRGSCSGTQVLTKKGDKYILTAAHCQILAEGGIIAVRTENGNEHFSRVVDEDDKSDLLLLEPVPNTPAIPLAKDSNRFDRLISFTHGNGYPTYSTEGVVVGEDVVQFIVGAIQSDADRAGCSKSKNKIEHFEMFGMDLGEFCTVRLLEVVTTVKLVPGSSGGMLANDKGEIVGVCSAGNQDFNYIVPLKDIRRFLQDR